MTRPLGNAHLESGLEAFFVKRVRLVGGYAMKFVPVIAGMPDRIVFMPNGRMYLVELKQKGEKPSKIQLVWHRRFADLGHHVVVLDTQQGVVDWIREIVAVSGLNRTRPGPRRRA